MGGRGDGSRGRTRREPEETEHGTDDPADEREACSAATSAASIGACIPASDASDRHELDLEALHLGVAARRAGVQVLSAFRAPVGGALSGDLDLVATIPAGEADSLNQGARDYDADVGHVLRNIPRRSRGGQGDFEGRVACEFADLGRGRTQGGAGNRSDDSW